MKSPMRSALFGFTTGLFFALAPSCGPTPTACDATSCATGCCDAMGVCQTSGNSTCGIGGASCQMCSGGKTCTNGSCTTSSAGGGAGGGSAGGAGGGTAGGAGGGTAGGAGGGTAGGAGGGTAGGAGGGTAGGAGGGTAGGAGGGTAGGSGGGTAGGAGGGTAGGAGGGSAGGAGGGTAGGAGGGVAAGDGGTYYDYFCAPLLDVICGYFTRCGNTASVTTCLQTYGRYIDSSPSGCGFQEVPAVKDGRMTFDGGAALRCLDAYKNTFNCNNIQADFDATPDCVGAQTGLVANNGSCFFDTECNSNTYCTAVTATCPGTCQPRKPAGAVSTTFRLRECQAGLTIYDSKCLAPPAPGGSCAPIAPSTQLQACPPTHYCNGANVCAPKKTTGAVCTTSLECALPNTCSNGTCGPRGGVGATCNTSPSLPCGDDLFCNSATYGGLGACAAPSGLGGLCWLSFNCQPGFYCAGATIPSTRGTCAPQKAPGQTCISNADECTKGYFCSSTSMTCQALKTQGQTCNASSQECGAHLTCSTTCVPDACYDPTP